PPRGAAGRAPRHARVWARRPRQTARPRRGARRGGSADGAWPWSPPLEFGRHEKKHERLRPALGAGDRLARFGRGEGAERGGQRRLRLDLVGDALGEIKI